MGAVTLVGGPGGHRAPGDPRETVRPLAAWTYFT